ncbi:DNA repair protein RecN [Flavobacteriaceae bacterium]|nr:DNA repair protein RecN [Flavobacteriaceae bacterium]MDB4256462.1 DNA repair protein RecN [Flavobacteriaceae bacterium]MDC0636919.1 DNA repair protein RecN [Flavobacteriaceae bacterium]
MLVSISIKNYALINELHIDFSSGLSIITGETGAGKSILLGALGLVLGNRADSSSLKNTTTKCVVEAIISIDTYNLQDFFETEDIDYESNTILRREILPSGKSRAFVNDTPVTLLVLTALRARLIDIHSQHQTLQVSDQQFQFQLMDAVANNESKLASYKRGLVSYTKEKKRLEEIQQAQREASLQYDYNSHLYNELLEAKLVEDEQELLEEKLDKINNVEEIKQNLSEALQLTTDENIGIQNLLFSLEQKLAKIASYSGEYQELLDRISSVKIESDDIIGEIETAYESVDFNPSEAEQLNDRLQLIYNLQKKHYVNTISELLTIQSELFKKVNTVENAEQSLLDQETIVKGIANKLDAVALKISDARSKIILKLSKQLVDILADLGMPHARFQIKNTLSENYYKNGKDSLEFLFSANKGGQYGELKKVASGGELSRVMLAIKKILSENSQLPTIIFDEIDSGVSGEISNKMAHIMSQMSQKMQVITITHLPQIAAKGNQHYKVFKEEVNNITTTNLKQLSEDERIVEIAEMLSGKNISDSALTHARELLN